MSPETSQLRCLLGSGRKGQEEEATSSRTGGQAETPPPPRADRTLALCLTAWWARPNGGLGSQQSESQGTQARRVLSVANPRGCHSILGAAPDPGGTCSLTGLSHLSPRGLRARPQGPGPCPPRPWVLILLDPGSLPPKTLGLCPLRLWVPAPPDPGSLPPKTLGPVPEDPVPAPPDPGSPILSLAGPKARADPPTRWPSLEATRRTLGTAGAWNRAAYDACGRFSG